MSLLDQLSSLCAQSNFPSTFSSFDTNQQSLQKQPIKQNYQVSTQKTLELPKQCHNNSQQKMIKLFDDEEMQVGWRMIKTEKKIQPEQKITLGCLKNLSQFNVEINKPKKDDQTILMRLTKMSYLMKNKLRKVNFDFFVRLEQYTKFMKSEQDKKIRQNHKLYLEKVQKGVQKLSQTVGIISLKYFQSNQLNHYQNLQQAFSKIRHSFQLSINVQRIGRIGTKMIYSEFLMNLQKQNKTAIKIDLFQSMLLSIINKSAKSFFSAIKQTKKLQKSINFKADQQYQMQNPHVEKSLKTNKINLAIPINLCMSKSVNPGFQLQMGTFFSRKDKQNIPLKLHGLKTHQQQFNLPDCIDNGHLLMNQVKRNVSFRQELENLTISNINNKTNNTSLNSSYMGQDNFILPQFNNDATERFEQKFISMQKSFKPAQIDARPNESIIKEIRKPRKSLIITKRKQSIDQIMNFGSSLYNSQRQKQSTGAKKIKSTTTSSTKINGQKQTVANDKEIIKRMLEQLNKKFSCNDKVIQISLSNKKKDPAQKKQANMSTSSKKMERKKIKSELGPVSSFDQKDSHKESKEKSTRKQYKIDLLSKKKDVSEQRKQQDFFINVNLNESSIKNKTISNNARISCQGIQKRMKQSRSQLTKKNLCLLSQSSEDNEICKILSKYKTKKPLIPQSSIKIDLVSENVNKIIDPPSSNKFYLDQSKPYCTSNQNMKKDDHQDRNKLFFKDFSVNISDQNTSSISQVMRNQPINDSFFIKKCCNPQFSSDSDSAMGQFINYLPSDIYLRQNQQENDYLHYASLKPLQNTNNSVEASQCFFTGSKSRMGKQSIISSSMQKKRNSFEKSREEWDLMFERQKGKFLKNQECVKMPKKKSILNEEVISEIKQKIQQCLILSQKDPNTLKGQLFPNKSNNSNSFTQTKIVSNQQSKLFSQQGSKKNSLSKLYTLSSKYKKQQL